MKKILLPLAVLILFCAYTIYVLLVSEETLIAFGIRLMSSVDTAQVVIDLYIFCGLACVWMYYDNKSSGKKAVTLLPYFIITAIFASIGPLLYIVVNSIKEENSKH